ncbi:hypothetical protein PIB30_087757, partial [Stylosanthes scabra]|nr:hypothetical protein [Stylosanthes scabra]
MVNSTRNKAILDELAAVKSRQEEFFSNHVNQYNMIRQEQKLLGDAPESFRKSGRPP